MKELTLTPFNHWAFVPINLLLETVTPDFQTQYLSGFATIRQHVCGRDDFHPDRRNAAVVVSVVTECAVGYLPHSGNYAAGVYFHGVDNCIFVNGL